MAYETIELTAAEVDVILAKEESQFFDFKRFDNFQKIAKTASAFANTDGGELLVGIADPKEQKRWLGFRNLEHANDVVRELAAMFNQGPEYVAFDYFAFREVGTFVLRCAIQKTQFIVKTPDGKIFVRQNASDKELKTHEEVIRLQNHKGVSSYEDAKSPIAIQEISTSLQLKAFLNHNIPHSAAETFLKRERVVVDEFANIAAAVLFDECPQSAIPQASVKIYRYKSINKEGAREELAFQPITIEGPAVELISAAVKKTIALIEEIPTLGVEGLESIKYPKDAIHEIVCNAVIHRDYSINDYIHIRIFDNRVEIESPGRLPGPVTVDNILRQRFARNKKIQRLLSKFPTPPNKDVGEGLNTAFSSMRKLNLKEPKIEQAPSSVIVRLSHEPLASHEEIILRFLSTEPSLSNTEARDICFEQSDSKMRKLFKKMIQAGVIEPVPGTRGKGKRYRKASTL